MHVIRQYVYITIYRHIIFSIYKIFRKILNCSQIWAPETVAQQYLNDETGAAIYIAAETEKYSQVAPKPIKHLKIRINVN